MYPSTSFSDEVTDTDDLKYPEVSKILELLDERVKTLNGTLTTLTSAHCSSLSSVHSTDDSEYFSWHQKCKANPEQSYSDQSMQPVIR